MPRSRIRGCGVITLYRSIRVMTRSYWPLGSMLFPVQAEAFRRGEASRSHFITVGLLLGDGRPDASDDIIRTRSGRERVEQTGWLLAFAS